MKKAKMTQKYHFFQYRTAVFLKYVATGFTVAIY
jgi:hypothetical protein